MLVVSEEVRRALPRGNIVALESTIITHGMPYPQNLETALMVEETVRKNGSVPATIAIIDGVIRVGLSRIELESLSKSNSAIKVSRRDISFAISAKKTGSTTVSATMIFAHMAGIRVFATGGIGGVHRGAESSFDISADITELARTPVLVVCAGAKSILDLPKTVELLETGGVSVLGFKTNEFPAFFTPRSGLPVSGVCTDEQHVANLLRAHTAVGLSSGLVLACPVPEDQAGDVKEIEAATAAAVAAAANVKGKDVTPFMLKFINEKTQGRSLKANIGLIRNNAGIAARVAAKLTLAKPNVTRSAKVVVIGAIGLDTIAVPEDVEIVGETKTSSPGSVRSSIGGVCRNVAMAIHQLGGDVMFYSAVGDDVGSPAHAAVRMEAQKHAWMQLQETKGRTAQYAAVMNGDGSLLAGIADMEIFDSFNPNVHVAPPTQLVIVSGNLSERTVAKICAHATKQKIQVWADCVSVVKAPKLLDCMHNLSLVKANLDELASLAAVLPPDVLDAEQMQEWITMAVKTCMHQNGGDKFLITCGSKGVYLYQSKLDGKTLPEQRSVTLPDKSAMKIIPVTDIEELHVTHYEFAPVDDIVDSTGAGDSLLGTTAWAHIEAQLPLEWAVVVGIAAARLTLRFTQAVAPDINNKTFKPLVDILRISNRSKL